MHRAFFILMFVPLAAACAGGGAPLAARLTREPGRHVEIWTAHAEDVGAAIVVRGLVRRSPLDNHPLWGHVHIMARFADARAPLAAAARWSKPSTRSSRTGSYYAELPIADAASITDIFISYAPGRHADEANAGSSL
jgi:hypothetical protein